MQNSEKHNLIWPNIETDKKENFRNIIFETIKTIEDCEYKIGEGRTAKVCISEKDDKVCVKIVYNKISKNRSGVELKIMDKLCAGGILVPKPICSVETDKCDYLFMEKIEGFSLKDLLDLDLYINIPGQFNFKEFFSKLKITVNRMNDLYIYHRDLHSGNIMISSNGEPIIIDMGDAVQGELLAGSDPYRETNAKGEIIIYPEDRNKVIELRQQIGSYLKNNGYFENIKKGE